ncbi:hypothetical protein ACFFW8_06540 [Erwinia tracheiphila]
MNGAFSTILVINNDSDRVISGRDKVSPVKRETSTAAPCINDGLNSIAADSVITFSVEDTSVSARQTGATTTQTIPIVVIIFLDEKAHKDVPLCLWHKFISG